MESLSLLTVRRKDRKQRSSTKSRWFLPGPCSVRGPSPRKRRKLRKRKTSTTIRAIPWLASRTAVSSRMQSRDRDPVIGEGKGRRLLFMVRLRRSRPLNPRVHPRLLSLQVHPQGLGPRRTDSRAPTTLLQPQRLFLSPVLCVRRETEMCRSEERRRSWYTPHWSTPRCRLLRLIFYVQPRQPSPEMRMAGLYPIQVRGNRVLALSRGVPRSRREKFPLYQIRPQSASENGLSNSLRMTSNIMPERSTRVLRESLRGAIFH